MISVIIPVFNEEEYLPDALTNLQAFRSLGHEVIVVDGGSADSSLAVAHEGADVVIVSKAGRALQMNSGASVATGDMFLFLHVDTVLPEDAQQVISLLEGKDNLWGRFDIRLTGNKKIFRVIESLVNFRSRLTSIVTGDQAIFIERDLFNSVGGFPEIALMEDIAISRLLKTRHAPVCLKQKVITSSRRWESRGVIATILLMWKLRLLYFFGVSPAKLNQLYR